MRRLSRADLLEMLIEQSVELKKTKEQLQQAQQQLSSREIAIDRAGSIAEAALQLNGVFEAAQASCEQYVENARRLFERQERLCRQRDEESMQKSHAMLLDTERRCAALEHETRERCIAMLKKARGEVTLLKGAQVVGQASPGPVGGIADKGPMEVPEAPRRRIRRSEKDKKDS